MSSKLIFDENEEILDAEAAVVIAVPAQIAVRIVPGLSAPDEFRPIVNAHFPSVSIAEVTALRWTHRRRGPMGVQEA